MFHVILCLFLLATNNNAIEITGLRVQASPALAYCETLELSELDALRLFQLFLWRICGQEATILHTRSCLPRCAKG